MEKIVIFGATGNTGLCSVEAAVNHQKPELQVRLFVRDISKLPEQYHDKVEVQIGDVLDQASVDKAVEGVTAVVIVLGTRNDLKPTTLLSEGMKNILSAMKKHNVKVVSVCLSAFLFYEDDKVPKIFVDLNADHKRMYEALQQSELNYIAVFPPHISEEPRSELILERNPSTSPGRAVSKWDLGAFLVDSLFTSDYYKSIVGICNKPKQ